MKKLAIVLIVVVLVIGAWFFYHPAEQVSPTAGEEVLVLCGGSMRGALEEIIKQYSAVSDDRVIASYGGSGELCAQIMNAGKGDLYVCHDPFMPWAEGKGVIAEWQEVASLSVALVVPKGNPKNLHQLQDLTRSGLRLGIGDQTYSTSGQITRHQLAKLSYGADILKNVRVETKGHQQRCNDVVMGTLDAALVWSAVAHLFRDKLEVIPLPEWTQTDEADVISSATYAASHPASAGVTVGIIKGSERREAVRSFYRFMTTRGRATFSELGFSPAAN